MMCGFTLTRPQHVRPFKREKNDERKMRVRMKYRASRGEKECGDSAVNRKCTTSNEAPDFVGEFAEPYGRPSDRT